MAWVDVEIKKKSERSFGNNLVDEMDGMDFMDWMDGGGFARAFHRLEACGTAFGLSLTSDRLAC